MPDPAKGNRQWSGPQLSLLGILLVILTWEVAVLAGYQPAVCSANTCGGRTALLYPLAAIVDWIKSEDNDKAVVAFATIGLMVFTATLWWSTYQLWQAGERQARISILGIQASDQASARQLELSSDATERQLRAYVGIEKMELLSSNLGNTSYRPHSPTAGSRSPDAVVIWLKNFGLTPANSVHTWVSWGGMPFGGRLPPDFDYPRHDTVTVGGPTDLRPTWTKPVVFPGQNTDQVVSINDLSGFIRAKNGERTMYVWGTITYLDAFKRPRETEFCFVFDPRGPADKRFLAYEEHNEAR